MENDGYESEVISEDDSIYRYLHSRKDKDDDEDEEEKDEYDEDWDNYFLNDYKLDSPKLSEQNESEKAVSLKLDEESSLDLQKDATVSKSLFFEQRLNMISRLKELHEDHKQLKLKNSFLHKKCRDIFIKLKIMNNLERWGFDSDIHNDKRYIGILKEFAAFRMNGEKAENAHKQELKTMEDSYQLYFSEFREAFQEFISRELEIGVASISKETKKSTDTPFINLLDKQKERLNILSRERVKYLKLRNLLENIHSKFDNRNILGGGYTMLKYENLMMNKNTLLEKVDDSVKDLEKIRDKFFSIVQMLAHVREVLVGIAGNIEDAVKESGDLETSRRVKRLELGKRRQLIKKHILKSKHFDYNRNS